MTAITPAEAQAIVRPARLRGFQSSAREIDDAEVLVRGTLPDWLRGRLLLNGPALWDLPRGGYRHWFDGLAMLHRVSFDAGGLRYRSRFLRSSDYLASTADQRPAMGGFGTDDRPGFWRRLRAIFAPEVTDNAAVVMSQVAGQWAASTESPRMIAFDPDTLDTLGELAFGDREKIQLMAAHGITEADGTYWNVGVEFGPTSTYKLFRVAPDAARREVVGRVAAKTPGYLHAFALTPHHGVVWEPALRAQPLGFLLTGKAYIRNFRWKPEQGSRVHRLRRDGSGGESWDIPPMMCFHAVQAYEDGEDTVLELVQFDDDAIVDELMLQPRRAGEPLRSHPRLARYRLRPGQARAEPEFFGADLELPQVHPERWARSRASVAWGAGIADPNEAPFLDRTVRVDLCGGRTVAWQRGEAVQLEPLYVARPGGAGEDDGVLLVPTLADGDAGTVVAVLHPGSMACIAQLELPQVVPFGFHAAWDARP
jgi:carotenoid cleavage dioxygenase-like enzyme